MPVFDVLSDGQGVTITELRAPFRIMVFAGRDRPEQPVNVRSSQRVTQTYYPGTSTASVQFHGTKEDPIRLKGWFHDPLNLITGGADARIALLRGLLQGGNLCRLVWGTKIIRQGRVEVVDIGFRQADRVEYEVVFAVDQANEPVALTPLPAIATSQIDVFEQARLAVEALHVAEIVDSARVLNGLVQ